MKLTLLLPKRTTVGLLSSVPAFTQPLVSGVHTAGTVLENSRLMGSGAGVSFFTFISHSLEEPLFLLTVTVCGSVKFLLKPFAKEHPLSNLYLNLTFFRFTSLPAITSILEVPSFTFLILPSAIPPSIVNLEKPCADTVSERHAIAATAVSFLINFITVLIYNNSYSSSSQNP